MRNFPHAIIYQLLKMELVLGAVLLLSGYSACSVVAQGKPSLYM